MKRCVLFLSVALLLLTGRQASATTFNFESAATGTYTAYVDAESGLTLALTREAADEFDIVDLTSSFVYASYGSRTVRPFTETKNFNGGTTAFIADFSSLISSFAIDAGDFTPSDTDQLRIEAYSGPNATGTLLASFLSGPCCDSGGGFQGITGSVAAANIASIRFIGGSTDFPNSLYFDNIVVEAAASTTVPEPASLLLIGTGVAGLGSRLRRQKAR